MFLWFQVSRVSRNSNFEDFDEVEKQISNLDKEFYQLKIDDLEEKLKNTKVENENLKTQIEDLKKQLENSIQTKDDISIFLNKRLQHKDDQIAEIQERLHGLEMVHSNEEQTYKKEIESWEAKFLLMEDQLSTKVKLLKGKLTTLEEFRLQREDLLSRILNLEEALMKEKATSKEKDEEIIKRIIMEKTKAKTEYKEKLKELAATMEQEAVNRLTEKSRKAIDENFYLATKIGELARRLTSVTTQLENERKKNRLSTIKGQTSFQ
ncbi:cilia- and flagella-associated protein 157-like [Artemia franciscana]|uniref:Cilia- and flagella-associated protein 157 n=1 Tax=Artemia franciscana TaxID=6661 RepID=A0AA88HDE3_ARTSF|nr:hypothetical protein QYM36_014877 [Artemia franciscana]